TLAAKAIKLLVEHLPASVKTRGEESLAHCGHCQVAAWLSIFGAMNTGFGLSHALGHQIGPAWNVPHGVTSCINRQAQPGGPDPAPSSAPRCARRPRRSGGIA